MSDFADGYQPEEYGGRIENGEHRLKIKDYTVGYSSKGIPMLTVEYWIEGATFSVKSYFVKNEYFNRNITQFFDAFGIPRGNFEYDRWIGRTGTGWLEKSEKGYMELKYLIPKEKSAPPASKPAAPAAKPAQKPQAREPARAEPTPADPFDDDIPF